MTRQTSIDAYNKAKESGLISKRRWEVYECLFNYGPMTQNECWEKICELKGYNNVKKDSVGPAFAPLELMTVISVVGKRFCTAKTTSKRDPTKCLEWDVTCNCPVKLPIRKTKDQIIKELQEEVASLRRKLNPVFTEQIEMFR